MRTDPLPLFRFEALDKYGEPVVGTLDADDLGSLRTLLLGRGWSDLALVPVATPAASVESAPDEAAALTSPREGHLAERDLPDLLDQVQTLVRARVPLPAGLRASAGALRSVSLRRMCERLADRIEAGDGLEAALAAESARFPAQVRGLIGAGVRTGTLALVLARVVRGTNLGVELRRRVLVTIAYPSLIAVALVVLILFVCRVTRTINVEVEGYARTIGSFQNPNRIANFAEALTLVTSFVADHDAAIALGLVGSAVVGAAVWRFLISPVRRGRIVRSLPAVGLMVRFAHLAEFCHLAAILVDAALPLPEALALAGSSVADPALAAATEEVAQRVAAGEALAEALRAWRDLPPALGQVLAWGATQPDLAGALRFAGEMFEARAEAQSKLTAQTLAGFLLILIFWLVCFAVAAIYLPIQVLLQMIGVLV